MWSRCQSAAMNALGSVGNSRTPSHAAGTQRMTWLAAAEILDVLKEQKSYLTCHENKKDWTSVWRQCFLFYTNVNYIYYIVHVFLPSYFLCNSWHVTTWALKAERPASLKRAKVQHLWTRHTNISNQPNSQLACSWYSKAMTPASPSGLPAATAAAMTKAPGGISTLDAGAAWQALRGFFKAFDWFSSTVIYIVHWDSGNLATLKETCGETWDIFGLSIDSSDMIFR